MNNSIVENFLGMLWEYYKEHGRHDMLWRVNTEPYWVVVSEIMLQQTQVDRVTPKFEAFVHAFPDWYTLADSPQSEVLRLWQGLGYNRRALNLQRTAQMVMKDCSGQLPQTREKLESLPGIGPATAGAVLAYVFDQPVVFIETNIRRVIIHHFFEDKESISDMQILPVLEKIVSKINIEEPGSQINFGMTRKGRGQSELRATSFQPQSFFWAMMDYGTFLKSQVANPNRRSKNYAFQSRFDGSDRQLRGAILKLLLNQRQAKDAELFALASSAKQRDNFETIVSGLLREGFVVKNDEGYQVR